MERNRNGFRYVKQKPPDLSHGGSGGRYLFVWLHPFAMLAVGDLLLTLLMDTHPRAFGLMSTERTLFGPHLFKKNQMLVAFLAKNCPNRPAHLACPPAVVFQNQTSI